MLRSVALALLFLSAAWAQTRSDARRGVFPEVDVREPSASPGVQESVQQTLQQSRVKAVVNEVLFRVAVTARMVEASCLERRGLIGAKLEE